MTFEIDMERVSSCWPSLRVRVHAGLGLGVGLACQERRKSAAGLQLGKVLSREPEPNRGSGEMAMTAREGRSADFLALESAGFIALE